MAKQLIPEELNELIQEYLTDGVLTDKERQVILKRAEKMGLDRDEIDLYLDAQVQKIDQAADAVVRRTKSKSCPYCGAPIPQLAEKCPECGQFITPQASEELQEILDNLEEALLDLKTGKDIVRSKATVQRYARKAKLYYSSNPKIKALLLEVEQETELVEHQFRATQRKDTIIAYTLKNTKFWGTLFLIISFLCFFVGCSVDPLLYGEGLKYHLWGIIGLIIGIISFKAGKSHQSQNKKDES